MNPAGWTEVGPDRVTGPCPVCAASAEAWATTPSSGLTVAVCSGGCEPAAVLKALRPVLRAVPEASAPVENGGAVDADRYAGRLLDLGALLDEPDEPLEYVVDEFAAPQAVTVLSGSHGIGKSALAVVLAGVAQTGGGMVAGMRVSGSPALILDAEQGRRVIRRRVRALGLPRTLGYAITAGLDVRHGPDKRYVCEIVKRADARLVVADSLRRMAPGVRENDDEMVAVLEGWASIAQSTDAAVILLAHRGKDTSKDYRGHTTIGDVADAVFALERAPSDTDRRRRRLRTVKFRLDEEPEDRWLRLTGDPFGIADAEPFSSAPVKSDLWADLLDVILKGFPMTQADALRGVGRQPDDKTGRKVIGEMLDADPPVLVRGEDGLRPAPGVVPR